MTVKALVISDRPDDYTGKKGLVKQQIITVMDVSETGERLAQPIEYALSDEEKPVHAGKLRDKVINLNIRELLPFGGRLRVRARSWAIFLLVLIQKREALSQVWPATVRRVGANPGAELRGAFF
jgi:hypothetical protein